MVELGLAPTRGKAQALILAGEVICGGQQVAKAGALLDPAVALELRSRRRLFVGRGGEKLDGALAGLEVAPQGVLAWDIGASTGGFTDCLLRRGAARVVAVDVGRGQIDASLRSDPRVDLREGINARHLRPGDLPGLPELVVVDVSFISLGKILPPIAAAAPGAIVVSLVKPQFEVGRGRVGRGGIVRDPALQEQVLLRLGENAREWGLSPEAIVESPLRGARGNREFFVRWAPLRHSRSGDWPAAVREAVYGGTEKTGL